MGTAYDLWRGVMYCVGVFVTCNVGGAALRLAAGRVSAMLKPRKVTAREVSLSQAVANLCGLMVSGMETALSVEYERQSFEDIQRQIRPEKHGNADKGGTPETHTETEEVPDAEE